MNWFFSCPQACYLIFYSCCCCRTKLKLDGLEDAHVLDSDNDWLADKHGCPAYVSPEILNTNESYSGRAADSWSLGVMLYTMLIGRYPFHDTEPSALFGKIRRGQYSIPDTVSSRGKCLIHSLLRMSPSERLNAHEILQHPWFNTGNRLHVHTRSEKRDNDQRVPDVPLAHDDILFEWKRMTTPLGFVYKFGLLLLLIRIIEPGGFKSRFLGVLVPPSS